MDAKSSKQTKQETNHLGRKKIHREKKNKNGKYTNQG